MRRGALAFVLLLCWVLSGISTLDVGAQNASDAQAAADAASFYSYLESIGDYNTEYDFIHPDARAVIPRAAVTGWFLDNYWPRRPQPATITDVRFVSWTWPVTGVTYPYAAEVSYTQVFWDGGANTVTSDVVRLVQDRNGVWRWFFGRSQDFVNDVIAQYVPQVTSTPYTGIEWLDATVNDLDSYWASFFRIAPVRYSSPRVVEFDQATLTSCGVVDIATSGAFYCGADGTVYLDAYFLDYVQTSYSTFTAMLVVAHEWGHHIQWLTNLLGPPSPALELQADCLAGAWARDLATRVGLTEADLVDAMNLSISFGDPSHGAGTLRAKAFLDGFYDGSQRCFGS